MSEQLDRRTPWVPWAIASVVLLTVAAVSYFIGLQGTPAIADGETARHAWRGAHVGPSFWVPSAGGVLDILFPLVLVGTALAGTSAALPRLLPAVAACRARRMGGVAPRGTSAIGRRKRARPWPRAAPAMT